MRVGSGRRTPSKRLYLADSPLLRLSLSFASQVYGFSIGESGLAYLSQVIGSALGLRMSCSLPPSLLPLFSICPTTSLTIVLLRQSWFFLVIDYWCNKAYLRNVAQRGPEARLYSAMFGGALVPLGALIFTFTSYPQVHWIAPCIGITGESALFWTCERERKLTFLPLQCFTQVN
jgi:hypothetical protein